MTQIRDLYGLIDHIKKNVSLLETVKKETGEDGRIMGNNVDFCCPFHNETKPSFKVNVAGEIQEHFFYCFGCERGGSIVDWVQYQDGVSLPEGLILLAERNGMDISTFLEEGDPKSSYYFKIMDAIVEACNNALFEGYGPGDTGAIGYMRDQRMINDDTLMEFKIGYCSSTSWLHEQLHRRLGAPVQFDDLQLLDLNNIYLWNNAVIFPVFDTNNKPIGFYSRPFEGNVKYISTSHSTPLYRDDVVYGLNIARKALKDNEYKLLVVEGQIDLLQMHSRGYKNAVAVCGLSRFLQKSMISTISNYKVNEVILIPDGDEPGHKKLMDIAKEFTAYGQIFVSVVKLDGGDPDDILKEFGRDGLDIYIKKAQHPVQYFIDQVYALSEDLTDQLRFLDVICKYINKFSVTYRELASSYIENKYNIHNALEYFITYSTNPRDIHDKDSEATLLKAIVADKELAYVVRQELVPEEFYVRNNIDLFKEICGCLSKYGTVSDEILASVIKKPLKIYWENLQVSNLDVDFCVQRIKELSMRRNASKAATHLLAESMDINKDMDTVMQSHRASVVEITDKRRTMSSSSAQDLADAFVDTYMERASSGKTILGTPLGESWETLNFAWSGLELGYVHIVSAATGVGKTSVAVNWFVDIITSKEPEPTLFISAEMSKDDIWSRMMSIKSGLSNTMIRTGGYAPGSGEWDIMMKAFGELRNSPGYIIVPNRFTISEIMGIIEYHRLKYGCKHVFIDYLQLIRNDGKYGSRKWEVLEDASTLLQNRAMNSRDPICLIGVAQQNVRGAESDFGSTETMGGAYKISQDAAKVVIFAKKGEDDIHRHGIRRGNVTMNIHKVRMGPSGILVDLYYDNHKYGSLRAAEASKWAGDFKFDSNNPVMQSI